MYLFVCLFIYLLKAVQNGSHLFENRGMHQDLWKFVSAIYEKIYTDLSHTCNLLSHNCELL